jgi:HAD superfamily hydrolase (TIGR01549 family)
VSLKAVLFDLDNTLIDRDGALLLALQQDFPAHQAEALAQQQDHQLLLDTWGLTQSQFVERLCQHIQPNSCLIQWLQKLQQRHQLALLSNGGSASQRRKLRASALDQVFPPEAIFISEEMGVAKPNPEIFRLALAQLQQLPRHCLYLGDQIHTDGQAARAAGLRFLRVLRPLALASTRQPPETPLSS